MAAPRPQVDNALRDDLDSILDFDTRPVESTAENTDPRSSSRREARAGDGGGLGIDEEIKIRKPRAPIAKLDEDRLLSAKGIPRLRRITKDQLKFKGKGHEFSDVSRLLNTYQLWLDDLFPKANFNDGLALIEKLGHRKRIKVMRQAWIDETKPRPEVREDSDMEDFVDRRGEMDDGDPDSLFVAQDNEGEGQTAPSATAALLDVRPEREDNGPDMDELDQLLAENVAREAAVDVGGNEMAQEFRNDTFADEEEAMAEMGW